MKECTVIIDDNTKEKIISLVKAPLNEDIKELVKDFPKDIDKWDNDHYLLVYKYIVGDVYI